jgi:tetratricopeptide (TPR) repeat protein
MMRLRLLVPTLLSALLFCVAGRTLAQEPRATDKAADAQTPDINLKDYVYDREEVIRLMLDRIKRNPKDDVSYQRLGELYERRAEETGALDDYARAEVALRKSLEIFPEGHRAKVSLAAVLCSQHKFTEGLTLAREALKRKPNDLDALATAGDALLETGRYDEAESVFNELHRLTKLPPVLSRLASLAEFKGQTEVALKLMGQAAADVLKGGGTPKDAGWFQARLGDIALVAGRIDAAEKYYAAVPQGIDAYHDATAGLGRIRSMQGRDADAIALYEKAVAIGPDPHMLAALGDLYIKTGHPEKATPLFDQFLKVTLGKGEYLRERAMFLANHNRDLPEALALARQDLIQRKDIYGYDALAWTLHKTGADKEAAQAMTEALKLGTIDANLYYHAGMIQARLGDRAKAREYLDKCLRLNPNFSPREAVEAKKTLDGLKPKD